MILEDSEIAARIESPLNLLNRLKGELNRKPSNGSNIIPFLPPTTDQIIEDIEDKLKSGGLKTKAAAIMTDCLEELHGRLGEVVKPEKLAAIASDMNKIIGVKSDKPEVKNAQVIIYAPQHNNETHYEVLHVVE